MGRAAPEFALSIGGVWRKRDGVGWEQTLVLQVFDFEVKTFNMLVHLKERRRLAFGEAHGSR